jgi:hypothetical protein
MIRSTPGADPVDPPQLQMSYPQRALRPLLGDGQLRDHHRRRGVVDAGSSAINDADNKVMFTAMRTLRLYPGRRPHGPFRELRIGGSRRETRRSSGRGTFRACPTPPFRDAISRHRSRPSRSDRDRSARPLAVLIAACVLVASLAACDPSDPQADAGSEWRRIDLPAAETATSFAWAGLGAAVVETELDGTVNAVHVDWFGLVEPIPSPPGDAPTLGLFPGDAGPVVVTSADNGTLLFHSVIDDTDVILGQLSPPAPQLEPLAVWWGTEDEGAILVAAYRQRNGTVGIHPMDWETSTFEPNALLFVDTDRLDEVHVAARVEATVVVGPVGPDPAQLPTGDHAWAMQTTPDFDADGQRLPRSWRVVSLDPRPDAVTDVEGWEGDVVVAGRLDNQPLVWAVDVRRIDLPELELGADSAVLVADPFWQGDDPAIGLETAEGPVLLLPEDGGWEQVELPKGRLDDVVAIRDVRPSEERLEGPPEPGDGRLLAIIDGVVWLRTY